MTTTIYILDDVPGIHPGTEIDLTRDWTDVLGVCWSWTGEHTTAGVPLMQRTDGDPSPGEPWALDEVYLWRGPLTPAPRATTAALAAAVLHAPYAGDDQVRPPLPTRPLLQSPAATAGAAAAVVDEEPKPTDPLPKPVPSPGKFAQFLERLRRGGAR